MSVGLSVRVVAQLRTHRLDVDLETGPGVLALVGPNGAGKSSLLSLILGAMRPDGARIEIDGDLLVDTAHGRDRPIEARRIAYVPQHHALFPHLTVRENVAFGLEGRRRRMSDADLRSAVKGALAEFDLESLAEVRPHGLSGGERQRVALARAIVCEPLALLLDEPLASHDVTARRTIRAALASRLRALGRPTIVVTHDPDDARELADRMAVLETGRIVQTGPWADLAAAPATPFIASFVNAAAPVRTPPARSPA